MHPGFIAPCNNTRFPNLTPPLLDLQQNLLTHLRQVARDRDPFLSTVGHFYVQHYIRQQFAQWGEVTDRAFEYRGRTYHNWELNLPAQANHKSKPPILIGAHYDAVPGSVGADDNATGIAVLLELARSLASHPIRYPVRLVAFDLEEIGLVGSSRYAENLRQQNQSLRLMISLEMLGYCDRAPASQKYPPGLQNFYPDQGNFIALIGNLRTIPDLIHFKRKMLGAAQVPCEWLPAGMRGMIVPDTRRSDHAPFWDAGYPALMVTDTANLRNPHYHKSSDRLETLDLDFLTGVCQGLIEGVRSL